MRNLQWVIPIYGQREFLNQSLTPDTKTSTVYLEQCHWRSSDYVVTHVRNENNNIQRSPNVVVIIHTIRKEKVPFWKGTRLKRIAACYSSLLLMLVTLSEFWLRHRMLSTVMLWHMYVVHTLASKWAKCSLKIIYNKYNSKRTTYLDSLST